MKEFARLERVTERTVWNWIHKGAVPVRRTPGGGVRIQPANRLERRAGPDNLSPNTVVGQSV